MQSAQETSTFQTCGEGLQQSPDVVEDAASLDPAFDWLRVGEMRDENQIAYCETETLRVVQILATTLPEMHAAPPPQLVRVREAVSAGAIPTPGAVAPPAAALHLCLGRADARKKGLDWMQWVLSLGDEEAKEAALKQFFAAARAVQEKGVMLGKAARADLQYVSAEESRPTFFFHIEHARHITADAPARDDVISRDLLHFLAGAHTNLAFRDLLFRAFPKIPTVTVVGRVGQVGVLAPYGPLCTAMDAEELAELAQTGAVLELDKATLAHGAQLPADLLQLCAEIQRGAAGAVVEEGVAVRLLEDRLTIAAQTPSLAERISWIEKLRTTYPAQLPAPPAQLAARLARLGEGLPHRSLIAAPLARLGGAPLARLGEAIGHDVIDPPRVIRVEMARPSRKQRMADFFDTLAQFTGGIEFGDA